MNDFFDATQAAGIIDRYTNGETLMEISRSLGCSTKPVRNLLRRSGVPRRPRGSKPLVVNPRCFAEPNESELAAYFIGLLFADGCIYERRPGHFVVNVGVQIRDRPVIDRLNDFIGGRYKVKLVTDHGVTGYGGSDQVRLAFSHPQIVADLMRHGLTPRKSFTAALPEHLAFNRNVWRGVIDGDGWIGWNRGQRRGMPIVGLCGSETMVQQFLDFTNHVSDGVESAVRRHRGIHRAYVGGRHAVRLAKEFYETCEIAISRKRESALSIMQWKPLWERKARSPGIPGASQESRLSTVG